MSVTVSDCFDIARSCLNNSKSKQLFSFPNEKRFANLSRPATSMLSYVQNLDTFSTMGARIGTERKVDIFKKRDRTPSPGHYRTKSIFESCEPKVKRDGSILIMRPPNSAAFKATSRD